MIDVALRTRVGDRKRHFDLDIAFASDEPFAALNPLLRQALRQELAEVRARWGIPMVMITHDVEDVLALANVAFLVDGGRVVREVDLDRVESREARRDELLPPGDRRPPRRHEERPRVALGAGSAPVGDGRA